MGTRNRNPLKSGLSFDTLSYDSVQVTLEKYGWKKEARDWHIGLPNAFEQSTLERYGRIECWLKGRDQVLVYVDGAVATVFIPGNRRQVLRTLAPDAGDGNGGTGA